MKYTVLLSGNNQKVISEFFVHMDFSFECLSCSDRYDDILHHMKYMEPDVFVYCLKAESQEVLRRFYNIERNVIGEKIPIVVIGDYVDCELFKKVANASNVTILQKPISYQNIEDRILKLVRGKREPADNARMEKGHVDFYGKDDSTGSKFSLEAEDTIAEMMKILGEMEGSGTGTPPARKHILVVDDDSSVLKLIKGHLSAKYDVATAINGKVAMKFLETRRTDLILLDYRMPGENGAEVLNKIRSNETLRNLPVVFLTGVSDREMIQGVLRMKPNGYLLKPIDMKRLSATIAEILE